MKNILVIMIPILAMVLFFYMAKPELINNTYSKTKIMVNPVNISDIKVKMTDGTEKSMSDYHGKVLMIVNVASNCGFTPQYSGLEKLYEQYKDKGFEILAFPCNDFHNQEPGTNEEIKKFCETNYGVTFTIFDKIKVLGDERCSLYSRLIHYPPEGDISWNFEKFIIDKNGNVKGRFKSKITPEDSQITELIEKELSK